MATKKKQKIDPLIELLDGHDEPDGTGPGSELSIEARYGVAPGEDWLAAKWAQEKPITERVIEIGGTQLKLDEGLSALPLDQLKTMLASSMPELKTGTVTESASNGVSVISVKPKAGTKG